MGKLLESSTIFSGERSAKKDSWAASAIHFILSVSTGEPQRYPSTSIEVGEVGMGFTLGVQRRGGWWCDGSSASAGKNKDGENEDGVNDGGSGRCLHVW